MWVDYQEGDVQGKEFIFDIPIYAGSLAIASSTGIDPQNPEAGFNQTMYDGFDITVDQLEGEINLPYIYERTPEYSRIRVPRSLLGGFTQLRINYQYIYYPTAVYSTVEQQDESDPGFVTNGSFVTPRTIVPRITPPDPPQPPPRFTIDEGQIKEALSDKIYEKIFKSNINLDNLDISSLQTTTSTDGKNYSTGRQTEDDQLILFKKDRSTPENRKDFESTESPDNPINRIALDISSSLAFTTADGVVDLSSKLDDEITFTSYLADSRQSSAEFYDPPRYNESVDGDIPIPYYVEQEFYVLNYTSGFSGQIIEAPFGEKLSFYAYESGDEKYKPNGTDPAPDEWFNKLNLSQLTVAKYGQQVDVVKAREALDTSIFELLPNTSQRQNDINNFFAKFQSLIGPKPTFTDPDGDEAGEQIEDLENQLRNRISTSPSNLKESSYITRTDEEADSANEGKTLETMRDTLNDYLGDVDNVIEEFVDERPEYENKSEGFLKIRRVNQAILIKSPTEEMSFDGWEQTGFTVTMWVRFLNSTTGGTLFTYGNPHMRGDSSFRLETMTKQPGDEVWSGGQGKFVYTKPTRVLRLVVWDNVQDQWMLDSIATANENEDFDFTYLKNEQLAGLGKNPNAPLFHERRFGYIYDNSVPYPTPADDYERVSGNGSWPHNGGFNKVPTWFTQLSATNHRDRSSSNPREHIWNFTQYTKVPTDNLDEWFFICATYNPLIDEIGSFPQDTLSHSDMPGYWQPYGLIPHIAARGSDQSTAVDSIGYDSIRRDERYWLNHKNPPAMNTIVPNSLFGNRCKVEIISRSDLLRARGYKVD